MKAAAIDNDSLTATPDKAMPRVRTLVIETPVAKLDSGEKPGESKQLAEDEFRHLIEDRRVIEPPLNLYQLSTLPEYNTELGPCLDAMETNIDGFGHRLICRVDMKAEGIGDALTKAVSTERVYLDNFFLYAGLEDSFRELRRKRRRDLESAGNAFWEIIRSASGRVQYFEHVKAYQVRITAQDADAVEVDMPILQLQPDGKSLKIITVKVRRYFRRFVQVSSAVSSSTATTGYKRVWFKQFGDPRVVDKDTGQYVSKEKQENWNGKGNPMPESQMANEVKHWTINATRSPYGLPRFVGVLLDIYGDRRAAEINYITFCNNNVPSLIIAVSNGEITEESVKRVSDFFEKVQGDDNRSKALIIEAEPAGEDGEDIGHIKIDVTPLAKEQIGDALFTTYSKDNRDKVRVSFRLPPILIGRTEDYTRATADTSRRLADEQVFAPERDSFDDWVNRILFPEMGVTYHQYKSNSPNTTDNAELVRILGGAEKTGGMTPRIARMVLEDILGSELPDFPSDFDPDVPFSLLMAEAVKNQADVTEPGQQLTALKRLSTLTELVGDDVGGGVIVETLLSLRKRLEDEWTEDLYTDEVEDE